MPLTLHIRYLPPQSNLFLLSVLPYLLPKPYNWKTYGQLNLFFWKKHQNTTLEEAKEMLAQSHQEIMQLAERFTNEELFSKGVFDWVGNMKMINLIPVSAPYRNTSFRLLWNQTPACNCIGVLPAQKKNHLSPNDSELHFAQIAHKKLFFG